MASMKHKVKFLCSFCGATYSTDTYDFGETLFLRACFGCDACHLSGELDHFLMLHGETEVSPQMYYTLTPYGLEEDGTFNFLIGQPNICTYRVN